MVPKNHSLDMVILVVCLTQRIALILLVLNSTESAHGYLYHMLDRMQDSKIEIRLRDIFLYVYKPG
jgi:hypothetical protein